MFYVHSPSCFKCARRQLGLHPLAMATRVIFFAQGCPCAEECSAPSWKKAHAWGETEDDVRELVVKHLMQSGHHKLSKADARTMAQLTSIDSYEDEEGPPAKRESEGLSAKKMPSPPAKKLKMLQTSSASSASSAGHIFVRAHEFQAAIDCVNRAMNSAQQAQRVALAASRAFADEVLALKEVKTNLEAIKASAEQG